MDPKQIFVLPDIQAIGSWARYHLHWQREILIDKLLGAGLGKSRHVGGGSSIDILFTGGARGARNGWLWLVMAGHGQ